MPTLFFVDIIYQIEKVLLFVVCCEFSSQRGDEFSQIIVLLLCSDHIVFFPAFFWYYEFSWLIFECYTYCTLLIVKPTSP